MAEILFAAQDLPSGYRRGDPIIAMPDGHQWGGRETLPDFVQVAIAGLDHEVAQSRIDILWEDAQPGDPEYEAPDLPDRRIYRHRRRIRLIWADLPTSVRNELASTGRYETSLNQVRNYIRKLRYDRGVGRVEETAETEF